MNSRESLPEIGLKDVNQITSQFLSFTQSYEKYFYKDRNYCEAVCLRDQIPFYFDKWESEDWFVGRASFHAIGFSPQVYTKRSGFGYFVEEEEIEKLKSDPLIRKENIKILSGLKDFWKKRDSVITTRSHFPSWVRERLPADEWTTKPGCAFPLYRMAGSQLDYNKLMEKGIGGLKNEINSFLLNTDDSEKQSLYASMLYALDTFSLLCDSYISHMKGREEVSAKSERIIKSLKRIRTEKPGDFHEAIQLFYLYTILSGSQNYGRIDDFPASLLVKDLNSGELTEEKAVDYLASLYRMMESRGTVYDGRAIIGGRGRKNEAASDQFALLSIKAIERASTVLPQLTLRFYEGQDPRLYDAAIETIRKGCVYPMLYNDDVNIPSVENAFGIARAEALQYLPYGCGEYTLYHRSFDTPNGIINLPAVLEEVLTDISRQNNGASHSAPPVSFEDLLDHYKEKVEYYLDALAYQQDLEYKLAAETAPFLYFSILYDSCIRRGKAIFDGGIDYLGGTMETYGNTVVCDSLYAIKVSVFEEKILDIEKLRTILQADFEGFDKERLYLKELPKYGNDHEGVDSLYSELHDHVCKYTSSLAAKYDLHHYLVVVINNDANTDLGFHTGATPDGRKSGKPLNNGNAPSPGNDQNGLTAFLNSIVKPATDIHAGAVQNIKFSKKLFSDKPHLVKAALKTYFKKGGAQAMITVVGRDELQKAMENPDEYRHLMVRVGGFSARFVELRKEVQLEILERTIY